MDLLKNQFPTFIRLTEVPSRIQNAWVAGVPFSLLRIGDGELSVLRFPDRCDEERIQYVFKRAFASRTYSAPEINDVRAGMISAILSADVVGLYDSYEGNDLCVVYQEDIDYAGIGGITACSPIVHIYLQSAGVIESMIRQADRITLISGRDLQQRIASTFSHAFIDQIRIPVERQYALACDNTAEETIPGVVKWVRGAIKPEGPHHLFLVGAGLLGKEYCGIVKDRGGFAIDVGSVFDYWANVPTREGKRPIVDGVVVLKEQSRWPSIQLGSTPDPQALARKFRNMFRPMEIIPLPR